jgi:hypothetical protein
MTLALAVWHEHFLKLHLMPLEFEKKSPGPTDAFFKSFLLQFDVMMIFAIAQKDPESVIYI